jgi:uncharacterized membrane protein (UPF0127 family)
MRASHALTRAAWIAGLAWLALTTGAGADGGLSPLDIVTSTGAHRYEVEVADTEPAREHGLMDRREMAANHGMLFEFPNREPVTFWMKNTYLSLDMIFIDADGTVRRVAQRATPLSEALIASEAPVVAVLELNAGQAAAIRLRPGDKVRFSFFH